MLSSYIWVTTIKVSSKQVEDLLSFPSYKSNEVFPQGTVLGPLMFLLYVNDIADKISPQTRIKLFADDCLLYMTIDTKP
jgi:hypothetical protein